MPVSELHKRKLSKNLAILIALFSFCALVWMITMVKMAGAAEITQCGAATPANLDADPQKDYCDIYTRQLAYAEETRQYHEQIEERRHNFAAPMNEARHNYEVDRAAFRAEQQSYNP